MAGPPPPPPPPPPDDRTLVGEHVVVEETAVVPPPRRPTIWPWLLAVLLVALGLLALGYVLTRESDDDDAPPPTTLTVAQVEVPLLTGLKEEPARRRLAEEGLRGEVTRKASARPRGVVVEQEPEEGATVEKGSVVAYVVSTGPPRVAVPPLVGLREADAVARAKEARLRTRVVRVASERPAGVVAKQAPAAGKKIRRGGLVTLTVSKGRPAAPVPDVVGLPGAEAVQALQESGFDVRVVTVEEGGPSGTVTAQTPRAGARAPQGSEVALEVVAGGEPVETAPEGTPPPPTPPAPPAPPPPSPPPAQPKPTNATVPDVVGLALADAGDALADAGLRAYVRYLVSDEPKGTVLEQAKAAGETVRTGSSVGVNVSVGPDSDGTTAAVPRVVGLAREQARQQLVSAGFETRMYEVPTDPSKVGKVLEQQPGARAPSGALVLLYVGVRG